MLLQFMERWLGFQDVCEKSSRKVARQQITRPSSEEFSSREFGSGTRLRRVWEVVSNGLNVLLCLRSFRTAELRFRHRRGECLCVSSPSIQNRVGSGSFSDGLLSLCHLNEVLSKSRTGDYFRAAVMSGCSPNVSSLLAMPEKPELRSTIHHILCDERRKHDRDLNAASPRKDWR
jgi:hypothetical protein